MALEIRVLVVEDDPETRMLTEALLSGRKGVCLCALAKDGLEGLELVEQTRPDIVLLDLILLLLLLLSGEKADPSLLLALMYLLM